MKLSPVSPKRPLKLRNSDARPPRGLERGAELKELLAHEVERLAALQKVFYADGRHALLVVLQGRDASGKDGTIRTVFAGCNPQGCSVASFKAPSETELAHDFLWRVHQVVPRRGMIGIFNRSHYEDVLVARVRNLVPRKVWRDRYSQINDFERMLSENRVIVLKFFLHISQEEQRERLLERLTDDSKNWKFRAGDLEDRALWKDYSRAYRDALRKCSTPWAPWYLVPADSNTTRNYLITRIINDAIASCKPKYPRAPDDILALAAGLQE
ncbi:MAG: PPK2 family polyphosphate kinase [Gemmatimonadaceae bacterium]